MYGIFTYISLICIVNVGKYTIPMDPMGYILSAFVGGDILDAKSWTIFSGFGWKPSRIRSAILGIHHIHGDDTSENMEAEKGKLEKGPYLANG